MIAPSDTVVLGEKPSNDFNKHMDLLDPMQPPDKQIEDSRHGNSRRAQRTGGSNYAMGDSSVRYMRWPQYLSPVNMWYVTAKFRSTSSQTP